MLWGPRDPIFCDRYLDDLVDRLPHADVHRFEGAGHLIAEDVDYAAAVLDLARRPVPGGPTAPPRPVTAAPTPGAGIGAPTLQARAGLATTPRRRRAPSGPPALAHLDELRDSDEAALVEMAPHGPRAAPTRAVSAGGCCRGACARSPPGSASRRASRATASRCSCRPAPTSPPCSTPACASARSSSSPTRASACRGLTRAVRGARPDHVIGAAARPRRRARARLAGPARSRPSDSRRVLARALGVGDLAARARRARRRRATPGRAARAARGRATRRDPLHLRLDRARQGRRLHARPARRRCATPSPPSTASGSAPASSPASRPSRCSARRSAPARVTPDMDVTSPAHPHRPRRRGGGRGRRRDGRLPLARRARERRRHRGRARRRRSPRARRRAHVPLGRRPRLGGAARRSGRR